MMAAILRWIERNVVAADPQPEPSRLDRLDGATR